MDSDRLEKYLNDNEIVPPPMSERKILELLEARSKRNLLIAVSLAAMLWTITLSIMTLCLYHINQLAAYMLAVSISIGLTTSGIFTGIVLKYKKAEEIHGY